MRLVALRAQSHEALLSFDKKQDLVSILSDLHDLETELVQKLHGLLWRVQDEDLRLTWLGVCNCHRRWIESPLHGSDESVHGEAYLDALFRLWEAVK